MRRGSSWPSWPFRCGAPRGRSRRAGAAARRDRTDRPDAADRPAGARGRRDPVRRRRHLPGRGGPARRRHRLDQRVVAGAGPDADPALRPGGLRRDDLHRHLVRPARGAAGRPTPRPARRARSSASAASSGSAGSAASYKKYLVYYAGPSVQANVCGTGGGDFDTGRSYAIIWLRECTDVPSDTVAAHELLHAFGALPRRRAASVPRRRRSGHPCDSPNDILYPYASGGPLSSLGARRRPRRLLRALRTRWIDIQDSRWLHRLDLGQVRSPSRSAAGRARSRATCRGRLRGDVHDAVGPGRRGAADRGAGRERPVHPLERLVHGQHGLRR